jgi:hypothetical protein
MILRSVLRGGLLGLIGLCVCLSAGASWATTSGLNNIPTADVTPSGLLVLQQITNFGPDQQTLAHLGFKWGPAENWEVGLDKRVYATGSGGGVSGAGGLPAGPWVLQAKYRLQLADDRTAAAVGVANVGDDSDVAGDSFPYVVLSHDAGAARVHGGYSWQSSNAALFVGVDKTFPSRLTLRADWIQANDQDESVGSFGFIQPLRGPWLIEGWVSFPTEAGIENTFTLKFDYVIEFGE